MNGTFVCGDVAGPTIWYFIRRESLNVLSLWALFVGTQVFYKPCHSWPRFHAIVMAITSICHPSNTLSSLFFS